MIKPMNNFTSFKKINFKKCKFSLDFSPQKEREKKVGFPCHGVKLSIVSNLVDHVIV